MCRIPCLLSVLLFTACASAMPEEDLKPWPPAHPGESRFVIRLPALDDEDAHRIELRIGKTLDIDCNRHWFGGRFERSVVSGWGYPMYRLVSVAGPASSMMACPEDEQRTVFVTVNLDDPFVAYNSKLPLVVYVPEGFIVRYRVWSANDIMLDAPVG